MNLDNIMLSVEIFNYVLIGSLILTCLIGFMRGMMKSIIRFFTRIIPLLLLFLFLDLFTSEILNYDFSYIFKLNQGSTLQEIMLYYGAQYINNGVQLLPGSELYEITIAIGTGVARIIIFYIGVGICGVLVTPILNLIITLILKPFKRKIAYDELGKRKRKGFVSRFIGATMHALSFIIVFILVTIPFFGPLSLLAELEDELKLIASKVDEQEGTVQLGAQTDTINELYDILHEFDNIYFRNIVNSLSNTDKPLDARYFGYLMRIETKNGTINLADLIDDVEDVTYLFATYYNNGELDYVGLLQNEKDKINELISENGVVRVLLPVTVEVLINNDVLKELEIEGLEEIDWTQEVVSLTNLTNALLQFLEETDFDVSDPLKVFANSNNEEAFVELGKALIDSQIFTKVGLEYAYQALNDFIDEYVVEKGTDLSVLKEVLDFRNLSSEDWENNLKVLAQMMGALYDLGLEDIKLEPSKASAITTLITKPFEFSTIQGKEQELLEALLDFTDFRSQLAEAGLENINFDNIDWEEEPLKIANIVNSVIAIMGDQELSFDFILSKVGTDEMNQLLDDVFASDFIYMNLIKVLDKKIGEFIDEQNTLTDIQKLDLKNIFVFTNQPKATIRDDVESFLEVLKDFEEMNLFEGNPDFSNPEALTNAITTFFDLGIIDGNESKVFDILLDLFEFDSVLDTLDITLDTNGINWDEEPEKMVEIILAFNDLGSFDALTIDDIVAIAKTTAGKAKLNRLFNALCESELFLPHLPKMIDDTLSSADLTEWYSDWFESQLLDGAIIQKDKWKTELEQLTNILVYVETNQIEMDGFTLGDDEESLSVLKGLLLELNKSNLFTLVPITTYLEDIIEETGFREVNITSYPDEENKLAWENEINTIFAIANDLNLLNEVTSNSLLGNNPTMIRLLTNLGNSVMLKGLQKELLQTLVDLRGFTPYIDLNRVDFENINWEMELYAINKINNQFTNLTTSGAIEKLDKATIETLMMDASEGQIATLIIGDIIHDQLANIFGANNPSGYDYTNQTIMAEAAPAIAKLIDLGNALKNAITLGYDDASIVQIGEKIKGLEPVKYYANDYVPAIMSYAGMGGSITTSGITNSGYTYVQEGEQFIQFFQNMKEDPGHYHNHKQTLQANSYFANAIVEHLVPLI